MIEIVCDPGSRYVKVAAARPESFEPVLQLVPSHEADDLGRIARRAAAALRPRLFEKVQLRVAGDGSVPRRSRALPLMLGPALARAADGSGEPILLADCGGLRTRVYEIAGGTLARTFENERCTAGGGRFVETMSAALGVGLEQLDECVARSSAPCRVSSPCLVFAESELISQVNGGVPREDALAGVLAHAAEKVAALVERARPAGRPLLACGGLARLAAFRQRLAAALPSVRLLEPPVDPLFFNCLAGLSQICGAPVAAWPVATRHPARGRDAA